MKAEKITAMLHVSMYFECPSCDTTLDLFDIKYMNDDGELWDLINAKREYDNNPWENISGDGEEFECPKCKKELLFDKLEY